MIESNQTQENIRFGGIERLYGKEDFAIIQRAHVCVVGVGGVGSWAVEALARTGVGSITLIDYDEVCISNTNRQIQAMDGNVGRLKIDVLKERLLKINPDLKLHLLAEKMDPKSAESLIQHNYDAVVDAIDRVGNKVALLLECKKRNIPVVMSGGAAGRKDPSKIKVVDMRDVHGDPLIFQVRRRLRSNHRFPRPPGKMKVMCVFSSEPIIEPQIAACATDERGSKPLDCNQGFGTATYITGVFGFLAAGACIDVILKRARAPLPKN